LRISPNIHILSDDRRKGIAADNDMASDNRIEAYFRDISGGRVLDVATGSGGFVEFLKDTLKDYSEIIGVDISGKGFAEKQAKFADDPIRFVTMDASALAFEDASFDTVTIANSLHHLADINCVLREMYRVLRPGGRIVVVEMFRDNQSPAQLSHVLIHHWWARVNRLEGIIHYPTLTRQQIVGHIKGLGLQSLETFDYTDSKIDPHDKKTLEEIERITNDCLAKIEGNPNQVVLYRDGLSLLERTRNVGFAWATEVIAVGTK
jgi:ubiquinone/menaquinone biosynthesis C-methylase UbiE